MSGIINSTGSRSGVIGRGHEVNQHLEMKTVDNSSDMYASGTFITGERGSGWNPNSHALVWFSFDFYTTGAAGNGADIFITGDGIGSTTSGHESLNYVGYYTPSYMFVPCAGQVLSASPVGRSDPQFQLYLDQSSRTDRYNCAKITLEVMEITV